MKKQDKQYLERTIKEFIYSDFFNPKQNLLEQIGGKAYKDFIIQKEKDYETIYNVLINLKYGQEQEFGRILEICKGPQECIACFDEDDLFDFFVLTQYQKEMFPEGNFELGRGILDNVTMETEKDYDVTNIFIRYIGILNQKSYPNLKDFDTIFNFFDVNYQKQYLTFLTANQLGKRVCVGSITNVYDHVLDYKELVFNDMYEMLKDETEVEIENIQTKGTVLKLIHNF